ncbi:MAG: hypothetical protein ACHQ7N_00090 [Candidatus Methylomirabilales bacterium]
MAAGWMLGSRYARPLEARPMLEFCWLLLASIPFVAGLTFVLLELKKRRPRPAVQEQVRPGRR